VLSGTAQSGIDFGVPNPSVVTWTAGDSADKTVTVPVTYRAGEQPERSFSVTVTPASAAISVAAQAALAVRIIDVDCGSVTPIAMGQTLSGDIGIATNTYCRGGARGPEHNTVRYRFTALAGEAVTIAMNSTTTSGVLDPYVYLLDSSYRVLAENDDITPGVVRNSLIDRFVIPADGTYYIDATTWSPTADNVGTYTLTLLNCGTYRAAGSCNLDVDDDGRVNSNDALLTLRALLGFSSNAMADGIEFHACATRRDAATILPFVTQQTTLSGTATSIAYDFDGNQQVTATTDGLLLARIAAGMPLSQAIVGAIGTNPMRSATTAIANYLATECSFTAP